MNNFKPLTPISHGPATVSYEHKHRAVEALLLEYDELLKHLLGKVEEARDAAAKQEGLESESNWTRGPSEKLIALRVAASDAARLYNFHVDDRMPQAVKQAREALERAHAAYSTELTLARAFLADQIREGRELNKRIAAKTK